MSKRESARKTEHIVGVERHATEHVARAVSDEQRVYVLHSEHCKSTTPDLRECQYSVALDLGIDPIVWNGCEDRAVFLGIDPEHEDLVPVAMPESGGSES